MKSTQKNRNERMGSLLSLVVFRIRNSIHRVFNIAILRTKTFKYISEDHRRVLQEEIRRYDLQDKSQWSNSRRCVNTWVDKIDHIGDREMHQLVTRLMREAGMEYQVSYRRTAWIDTHRTQIS